MNEFIKQLPGLVRPETIPEIPARVRWKSVIFGKRKIWEYIGAYYEEESEGRVPFYLPYIFLKECYRYLCKTAGITKKQVRMVLIDGGDARIDYVLYEFLEELNYLTIITERPAYFESLQERAFQKLGLLIDLVLPWEEKQVQGNLLWDFTDHLQKMHCYPEEAVCFVPHKKEWENTKFLKEYQNRIVVSVGGVEIENRVYRPSLAECFLVPEHFPFRQSRCEELKQWCLKKRWNLKMNVRKPQKP